MTSQEELLDRATDVHKSGRRLPTPAQLVEMRQALDGALTTPEPTFSFRWIFAGAAMAACVLAAVLLIDDRTAQVERSYALTKGTTT